MRSFGDRRPGRGAVVRSCRAVALALAAAAGLVVATASPAAAHAQLVETSPGAGEVLATSPDRVELRFDESVTAGTGAVRVFDAAGDRLDGGDVYHPDGAATRVAVDLPALDQGGYVVTWRVTSADAHPVQGAFTFRVGESAGEDATDALAERLLAAQGGSTAVGGAYAVDRALVFASLLLLVGGAWFVAGLWPAGAGDGVTRRVLTGAWAVALVTTLAGIGLQGAYGAGLGLDAAVDLDVIGDVLDTRFGRASLARLALLCIAAPLLVAYRRTAERTTTSWGSTVVAAFVVGGVALLVTVTASGHATTGRLTGAAIVADAVHLAAAGVWIGGLAVLTAGVLRRGVLAELDRVVPRFSRVAFAAVVVLVVSGTFQAWRQLDTVDALTDTTYGQLLTVKVALVAGILALAAASRSWVRRRYGTARPATTAAPATSVGAAAARPSAAGPPEAGPAEAGEDRAGVTAVGRLRRSVAGEVVVAVAVVAATALLVNAVPGEQALAQPFASTVELGDDLLVDVVVDPAKAGPVEIHLYTLTAAGAPAPTDEVTMVLRLPERGIGPLEIPLERAGPNHFLTLGADIPIAGTWQIEVGVRVSEFDLLTQTTDVTIR